MDAATLLICSNGVCTPGIGCKLEEQGWHLKAYTGDEHLIKAGELRARRLENKD
jgi:hypothetical protein